MRKSSRHRRRSPRTDRQACPLFRERELPPGIRIQHGSVVFYLPGDIQTEDIDRSPLPFVDRAKIKCNILITSGHGIHGSKSFTGAMRPDVSIAGVFPRYAHGLKSTPELKAAGAKTHIMGIYGWAQVISDGKSCTVTTEHPDAK